MFNSKGTTSTDLSEKEALEAICKKNESVLAKLTAILE